MRLWPKKPPREEHAPPPPPPPKRPQSGDDLRKAFLQKLESREDEEGA